MKRLFFLLLAIAFSLGLVACNDATSPSDLDGALVGTWIYTAQTSPGSTTSTITMEMSFASDHTYTLSSDLPTSAGAGSSGISSPSSSSSSSITVVSSGSWSVSGTKLTMTDAKQGSTTVEISISGTTLSIDGGSGPVPYKRR